jgi:hypothetical protein
MNKTCIINYAEACWWKGGGTWYPQGQARLVQSLKDTGNSDLTCFAWKNADELGCPSHADVPYAFKPYALQRAKEDGYELVLWCDASVWAIKNIQPVFDHLAKHSHLFFHNSNIGRFTSDACLDGFNLSRDKAMNMDGLMGICMGFNLTMPVTQEFLQQWLAKAKDGFSFPGTWNNDQQQVSKDPRCVAHRHDQSVASIIACNLGMKTVIGPETFFTYYEPTMPDCVVLTARGM